MMTMALAVRAMMMVVVVVVMMMMMMIVALDLEEAIPRDRAVELVHLTTNKNDSVPQYSIDQANRK
jgi:hypothetical protein